MQCQGLVSLIFQKYSSYSIIIFIKINQKLIETQKSVDISHTHIFMGPFCRGGHIFFFVFFCFNLNNYYRASIRSIKPLKLNLKLTKKEFNQLLMLDNS